MHNYDRAILAHNIAVNMADLYEEADNNPEYYQGMLDLGTYLIGGDPDSARNILDGLYNLLHEPTN